MRLILALLGLSLSLPALAAPPTATLDQGTIRGEWNGDIAVFRGIPFAGDTGGDNRWRPPTPAPRWEGVRDATVAGPICPQSQKPRQGKVAPWLALFEMSEDCLNLSVYSPGLAAATKAPVMVWIHGGFARISTGSRHDASEMAARGVVVVTLNYRLDRLGLFAHPALSAEQPDALLGNYALMDAQAGLRWVQDNIAALGGDPDNVTIFGQSSGGVAVTALMGSPLSEGLFHRAIAQSGVMADLDTPRYLDRDLPRTPSLESDGVAMARALLPGVGQATTAQLRALPWQAIIDYTATQPAGALVPVTDGRLLPEAVTRRFAAGRQMPVPLLIGTTSWEQSLFVHHQLPLKPILGPVPVEQAREIYPGLDDKALVDHWLADTGFHAAARLLANASVDSGQPTWVYRFAWPSGSIGVAGHCLDVPFFFDCLDGPGIERLAGSHPPHSLAAAMHADVVAFASTGAARWPRWTEARAARVYDVPVGDEQDAYASVAALR